MPSQESDLIYLLSARCFDKLDLLQGCYQLTEEAQEIIFTITTPFGACTPKRVPQGVLNDTSYLKGVMVDLKMD